MAEQIYVRQIDFQTSTLSVSRRLFPSDKMILSLVHNIMSGCLAGGCRVPVFFGTQSMLLAFGKGQGV